MRPEPPLRRSTNRHLLAFPLTELPELDKGKGNKLIQIPPKKLKSGDENVLDIPPMRSHCSGAWEATAPGHVTPTFRTM